MHPFRQPPVPNLSAWLDLATRYFVPSAQARIRAEIEAYYAEAVQAYLVRDLAEPAARAAALADLGRPFSANRRFRRKYVTQSELGTTNKDLANRWGGLLFGALIYFFATVEFWQVGFSLQKPASVSIWLNALDTPLEALFAWLFFSAYIISFVLAGRKATVQTLRQLVLLDSIRFLVWAAVLLLILLSKFFDSHPNWEISRWFWLLCCVGYGRTILNKLSLRRRLMTASEDDLAPRDPATT